MLAAPAGTSAVRQAVSGSLRHVARRAVAPAVSSSQVLLQQPTRRCFNSQADAALNALFDKVPAGVKEVLQEPMAKMTKQMDSLKDGSVEHISGVVHALILLSRSNLISEAELDEKLGKLLPPQAVAIVKEQAKLLPADPYMSKLEDIASKLEALTKKVEGMGAAPAGGKK